MARLAPLLLLIGGCGYYLVHLDAPFGVKTICVVPFVEEEPLGLSPALTAKLSTLLAAEGLVLTTDRSAADGVLTGRIVEAGTAGSATNTKQIQIYRFIAKIEAQLVDQDGTKLWQKTINLEESFLPNREKGPSSALATDANRIMSLRRLAAEAARQLHTALVVESTIRAEDES